MRTQRVLKTAVILAAALTLAGCTTETSPEPLPSQPLDGPVSEGDQQAEDTESVTEGADLATTEFATSWQEAVDIAQDAFDGGLVDIELEWASGRYAYTVGLVSDTEEFEISVDASTGETFGEERESLDADDRAEARAEIFDPAEVIAWEDALEVALQAHSGRVNEWRIEGERGPRYEFEIDDDSGDDVEVSVDALSGDLGEIDR